LLYGCHAYLQQIPGAVRRGAAPENWLDLKIFNFSTTNERLGARPRSQRPPSPAAVRDPMKLQPKVIDISTIPGLHLDPTFTSERQLDKPEDIDARRLAILWVFSSLSLRDRMKKERAHA
jgi:hypothetical protein